LIKSRFREEIFLQPPGGGWCTQLHSWLLSYAQGAVAPSDNVFANHEFVDPDYEVVQRKLTSLLRHGQPTASKQWMHWAPAVLVLMNLRSATKMPDLRLDQMLQVVGTDFRRGEPLFRLMAIRPNSVPDLDPALTAHLADPVILLVKANSNHSTDEQGCTTKSGRKNRKARDDADDNWGHWKA